MIPKRTFLLLFICSLSIFSSAQMITVRGSDSMLMLGQRWSQRLAIIFPSAPLNVNGGGVTAAISGIDKGRVDVVQSTHRLTTLERNAANHQVLEIPVGIESIVFYVNDSNPMRELTVGQLRDLYLGKIENWKEIGGPDLPVSLVSLETFVGGSPFLKEVLLNNEEVDTTARGYSNPKEVAEHVSKVKGAVGFGPLTQMKGIHPVAIRKGFNFPAVMPTSTSLRTMEYPLSRYLYWTLRAPVSPNVRRISNWVLSSEGQLIVESLGYYPLDGADRGRATGSLADFK